MYLDNSFVIYLQDIDPFFLSLAINGQTIKCWKIDLGESNTIMSFKVMDALGLEVNTKHVDVEKWMKGKCLS